MFKHKLSAVILAALFLSFFCFGEESSSASTSLSDFPSTSTSQIILRTKLFKDPTRLKKYTDLFDEDFQEITLPYFPGLEEGTLWLEFEVARPYNIQDQLHNIYIKSDHRNSLTSYVFQNGNWTQIKNNTATSFISSAPLIPLMKQFFAKNDVIRIRTCITTGRGSPIDISDIPNKDLLQSITISISMFYLSAGIGLCFCFGLLIVGLLLRDTAYLLLALSSFCYIIITMQTKNMVPLILWNGVSEFFTNPKFYYFVGCIEVLLLSISGHCFYIMNRKNNPFPKPLIVVIELSIIEALLILTITSPTKLFISCTIIPLIQFSMLTYGAILRVKEDETENKIIFLGWSITYFFFSIHRVLLLLRNITGIQTTAFLEFNENVTSTISFLLLFIPPLYSIGKRFNIRYQFVQNEYQDLELRFMNQSKTRRLTDTVLEPVSSLASSVLNSACILSKLNFSAVNAEYIELIKRHSAKISDLLTAVRIVEHAEELTETPIMLLNFFNSCMLTIRRTASERSCTASLTTAIANDTIVSGDPRILQLLFIIPSTTIIQLTKPNTKISIYIEENDDAFTMTISNKFDSEGLDNPQKIMDAFNEVTFFDFINELGRLYNTSVEIYPVKDNCRITFTIHLDKIEDTSDIKVVTEKTTFEMSENSSRLFKDMEKQKSIETEKPVDVQESPKENLPQKEEEKQQSEIKDIFDPYNFSTREKEIATLIIEGKSDKEIAFELNISPQTVATHNKKIFKKMEVHSRVELINKVR